MKAKLTSVVEWNELEDSKLPNKGSWILVRGLKDGEIFIQPAEVTSPKQRKVMPITHMDNIYHWAEMPKE